MKAYVTGKELAAVLRGQVAEEIEAYRVAKVTLVVRGMFHRDREPLSPGVITTMLKDSLKERDALMSLASLLSSSVFDATKFEIEAQP